MIPGVPESRGRVGPSLAGVAFRPYIAGALPNMSGGLEKESITLMKLSVLRLGPAFCAALAKVSMML